VPVAEVASVEDLNKPGIREKFDGKIFTSEVGNGQYKLTVKAMEDYALTGYKLVGSSESGMLDPLAADGTEQRSTTDLSGRC